MILFVEFYTTIKHNLHTTIILSQVVYMFMYLYFSKSFIILCALVLLPSVLFFLSLPSALQLEELSLAILLKKANLVVLNSLTFCLSENVFIPLSFHINSCLKFTYIKCWGETTMIEKIFKN